MASEFDDLIPGSVATTGGPVTAPQAPGADFSDLTPAAPAPPTAEQERALRLRKIARASVGGKDPGVGARFSDAFTLGLMKPVSGVATGLGNMLTGQSGFGEGYQAGVGGYQDYLDEASKNSGWAGTAADVGGSILAGGPARGVVQQGLWPMLKSAAGYGAVEGAARNSEDLGSAAKGAAEGAAAAGATVGVLHGAGKMVNQARPSVIAERRAERLANRGTDPVELKNQARMLYKQLDDAGIAYNNNQSTQLVDAAISDLKQNAWSPKGVHASLNGVIDDLQSLRGQPMSLEKLQMLREQLGAEAGSNEPQVRRIAGRLLGSIDSFVGNVDPALSNIPGDQVAPIWKEARGLWRSANTAADIGWRLDKATRRSESTSSGTNIDNPIRQNVRSVIDRATQPGRFNPYKPDELKQMEKIVSGSPTQNLLRSVGNRFGGSGPMAAATDLNLGGIGGLGALFHGAEPTTSALLGAGTAAGLYGAGKASRMAADRMSENQADDLVRLISTGSLDKAPMLARQTVPTRASLARLMAGQSLERGAGIYAGGQFSR